MVAQGVDDNEPGRVAPGDGRLFVLHDEDRVGVDLQRGELIYGGGDLPQAAGGSAQGGVSDDDADLARKRSQPKRVEVAVGDVGGVGVLGRLGEFAGVRWGCRGRR